MPYFVPKFEQNSNSKSLSSAIKPSTISDPSSKWIQLRRHATERKKNVVLGSRETQSRRRGFFIFLFLRKFNCWINYLFFFFCRTFLNYVRIQTICTNYRNQIMSHIKIFISSPSIGFLGTQKGKIQTKIAKFKLFSSKINTIRTSIMDQKLKRQHFARSSLCKP